MTRTLHNTGYALTLAAAVAIVFAAAPAPRAQAGESEWATAGKILAGVTAVHLLTRDWDKPTRTRTTVHESTTFYRPATHVTYRSTTCHRSRPRHRPAYRPHHQRRPYHHYHRTTPIVVQRGPYRRLYQPPVRGHVAFIQKRPYVGHPWITVRKHPSIW